MRNQKYFFHVGISSSNDSQGVPMPLTDTHIRSLKPNVKPHKYFDCGVISLCLCQRQQVVENAKFLIESL